MKQSRRGKITIFKVVNRMLGIPTQKEVLHSRSIEPIQEARLSQNSVPTASEQVSP